ncbi:unnamed protein product [Cylicostephanus goldi]|uniref:Uncharacterized protein n=1 Tax=Cylicostephanus goldi TaxID=71465 RepID=A0A3P6R4Y2_CYLGO|nr:unnamed protein product [Cylicostephanus goldi]
MNLSLQVPIPSWYAWPNGSPGLHDRGGLWQLITANSTCAVTLIANNHDNANLQYDSYLVLPTNWAKDGYVYAFTLPRESYVDQSQQITIIPTEKDVRGVLNDGGGYSVIFTAKLVGPTTYYTKLYPVTTTYNIIADGPILVSFLLETCRKQK